MTRLLHIRKLADKSAGQRIPRYDPITGVKVLVDPDGPEVVTSVDEETGNTLVTYRAQPWPLLGVQIEGDAPKTCDVGARWVARAKSEGWLTLENERVVHRSGGPKSDPWRTTHSFVHADFLVLDTVNGAVRYRVVENPDKWPEYKDGDTGHGGEVRHYYELELVEEKAGKKEEVNDG